jgi:hypothetical protein
MNDWLAVVATIAVFGCATPGSEYQVRGTCSGGLTDGTYELVLLPDNVVQVSGSFSQGKKNGVYTFASSSGETVAVIPYREDQIDGQLKLWYLPESGPGNRKLEAAYAAGVPSGTTVSWYPDGARRAVFHYVDGKLDRAEAWATDGTAFSAAEATAIASADLEADRQYFDALEGLIRENLPRCP